MCSSKLTELCTYRGGANRQRGSGSNAAVHHGDVADVRCDLVGAQTEDRHHAGIDTALVLHNLDGGDCGDQRLAREKAAGRAVRGGEGGIHQRHFRLRCC